MVLNGSWREIEAARDFLVTQVLCQEPGDVDLARALSQALERQPPPPARLQLLRRVAAAASGFRFDEALALLSWDAGAPAGAPPA